MRPSVLQTILVVVVVMVTGRAEGRNATRQMTRAEFGALTRSAERTVFSLANSNLSSWSEFVDLRRALLVADARRAILRDRDDVTKTAAPPYWPVPGPDTTQLHVRRHHVKIALFVARQVADKFAGLGHFAAALVDHVNRVLDKRGFPVPLAIYVTKLVILNERESWKTLKAEDLWREFCRFQSNYFTNRRAIDVSLLITTNDVINEQDDVVRDEQGYAKPGEACSRLTSCMVVYENGLDTYRYVLKQLVRLMNVPRFGTNHDIADAKKFMKKATKWGKKLIDSRKSPSASELELVDPELLQVFSKVAQVAGLEIATKRIDRPLPSWQDYESRREYLTADRLVTSLAENVTGTIIGELKRRFHGDPCIRMSDGDEEGGIYVMSSRFRGGSEPSAGEKWSRCTRQYVNNFLLFGERARCFLDPPRNGEEIVSPSTHENFTDANEQCRLKFGSGFTHAVSPHQRDICGRPLTCLHRNGTRRTGEFPPLHGTRCSPSSSDEEEEGSEFRCRDGECAEVAPGGEGEEEEQSASWGSWSKYSLTSHASLPCVQVNRRQRRCMSGSNFSKRCLGAKYDYKVIEVHKPACRRWFDTHANTICRKLFATHHEESNQLIDRGVYQRSFDHVSQDDVCKIHCKKVEQLDAETSKTTYYKTKSKAPCGTRCGPDLLNICIRGRCMQLFNPIYPRRNKPFTNRFVLDSNPTADSLVTSLMTIPAGSFRVNVTLLGGHVTGDDGSPLSDRNHVISLRSDGSELFPADNERPAWFSIPNSESYLYYSGLSAINKHVYIKRPIPVAIEVAFVYRKRMARESFSVTVHVSHYEQ